MDRAPIRPAQSRWLRGATIRDNGVRYLSAVDRLEQCTPHRRIVGGEAMHLKERVGDMVFVRAN